MIRTNRWLLGTLPLLTTLAACESTVPGATGQISFNVGSRQAGVTAGIMAAGDSATDGNGNVLVLNQVELVLRDIEFRRLSHDQCDSVTSADNESCEEVETGPFLVDLPIGGGVEHSFSVAVDSGTFDEVRLRLHKPEDDGDARDQAFLASHPEFEDISVRVTGTFNGTPFTFISDMNADQELGLDPVLTLTESADVSVTLSVDLSTWFRNGLSLVDPAEGNKGGSLEQVVKNNIEASFEAFRDNDRDGHSDDD
jgi:hypothetical protein